MVGSSFKFKKYGKCGMSMAELFPNVGELADDLCLVRSVQTDHVLHEAAMSILFTGSQQLGRPSWGSWITYALGSENKDLPEFVVMITGQRDGGSPRTRACGTTASSPGDTKQASSAAARSRSYSWQTPRGSMTSLASGSSTR